MSRRERIPSTEEISSFQKGGSIPRTSTDDPHPGSEAAEATEAGTAPLSPVAASTYGGKDRWEKELDRKRFHLSILAY